MRVRDRERYGETERYCADVILFLPRSLFTLALSLGADKGFYFLSISLSLSLSLPAPPAVHARHRRMDFLVVAKRESSAAAEGGIVAVSDEVMPFALDADHDYDQYHASR